MNVLYTINILYSSSKYMCVYIYCILFYIHEVYCILYYPASARAVQQITHAHSWLYDFQPTHAHLQIHRTSSGGGSSGQLVQSAVVHASIYIPFS